VETVCLYRIDAEGSTPVTKRTLTEASMNTEVSILHHDYPSRLRETVEQKVQPLSKFYDQLTSMHAKLERLNEQHRVELVANVAHGPTLVADGRGETFNAALEDATSKMTTSIKRVHDKHRTERRRQRRTA